MEHATVLI